MPAVASGLEGSTAVHRQRHTAGRSKGEIDPTVVIHIGSVQACRPRGNGIERLRFEHSAQSIAIQHCLAVCVGDGEVDALGIGHYAKCAGRRWHARARTGNARCSPQIPRRLHSAITRSWRRAKRGRDRSRGRNRARPRIRSGPAVCALLSVQTGLSRCGRGALQFR